MKTEKEIRAWLLFNQQEYVDIIQDKILCENKTATLKYYQGVINTLKFVLGEQE